MNDIISDIIESYGDIAAVQARFKYKQPMGVYNWRSRGIPKSLVADIHEDTGIPIKRLKKAVKA